LADAAVLIGLCCAVLQAVLSLPVLTDDGVGLECAGDLPKAAVGFTMAGSIGGSLAALALMFGNRRYIPLALAVQACFIVAWVAIGALDALHCVLA
jgi:hypothetical protein